jgi:hypothetical protein
MSNKNLTILSHTTRPPVGRVQVTKVKDMKSRGLMLTCDTIVYKNYDGSKNIQDCDNAIVCISGEATVWLPNKTISSEN